MFFKQNLHLRCALLGVFFWTGLSVASASSRDHVSDSNISKHSEVFASKKSISTLFFDNLDSGPAVGHQSIQLEKTSLSIARLKYDEDIASLWHRHYQDLHLSFRANLLRQILMAISHQQETLFASTRIS